MGDTNNILPDFVAPTQARKIRAPKHDFKNGLGKVFAHKHSNGGGWVADTAYVAESVKVSAGASVWGFARVTDNVVLSGKAQVGDHARVMHHANIAGAAIVRNSALVCDDVQLAENVYIGGQARVSGNSVFRGRVVVDGHAIIHNSRVFGPRQVYGLNISDRVKIFDSQLHGAMAIADETYLYMTQLYHVNCAEQAKIVNSSIATTIDWQISQFVAASSGRGGRRTRWAVPEAQDLPSLTNQFISVTGTVMHSHLRMRPVLVSSSAYLINVALNLYHQELAPLFNEFPGGVIHEFNTHRVDALVEHYRSQAAGTMSSSPAIPVIASVGAVPNFDQTRQRRIMRIEEAT